MVRLIAIKVLREQCAVSVVYGNPMNEQIDDLESKIDQLVALCERLHAENQQLIADCNAARVEKSRMHNKNREASRQIGEIIDELRAVVK